jgi:predicted Fe-Mo cluster-binding NifX family protein
MRLRFAIPLTNGQLSTHFGHCEQFVFIDLESDKIVCEEFATPPAHEPGVIPIWLADKGTTDVIAGGIGAKAIELLTEKNIDVHYGVKPKMPET